MTLHAKITTAYAQGKLLVLWAGSPYPLAERPPANRAVALNLWTAQAEPPLELNLAALPPLPLLSLEPGDRIERAFQQAGLACRVVITPADVPAATGHSLLKLGGDLASRRGVILSRAELADLSSDSDKHYLLAEARRRVEHGALLVLGAEPAHEDFRVWWSVLWPALGRPPAFGLGDSAGWPAGITGLSLDFGAVAAALAAVPRQEAAVESPMATSSPPANPSPAKFDTAALRRLLTEAFDDETLTTFVFDNFPEVYHDYSRGLSKGEKIQRLIQYCQHHLQFERLLALVRQHNPAQSQRFAASVSDFSPPPPDEPKPAVDQRCADLAEHLRETRELLRELEEQRRLSSDPKEKRRAERDIREQKQLLAEYQAEAKALGCPDSPRAVAPVEPPLAKSTPPPSPPPDDDKPTPWLGYGMAGLLALDLGLVAYLAWPLLRGQPELVSYLDFLSGFLGTVIAVLLAVIAVRQQLSPAAILHRLATSRSWQIPILLITALLIAALVWSPGVSPATGSAATTKTGLCRIESFAAEPVSPQPVGQLVTIKARGACQGGLRAIRLFVNGEFLDEKGGHAPPPDAFDRNWPTQALAPGPYHLTAEIAAWGDDTWQFAARQTITYTLVSSTTATPKP